jgi:hypothetical protein
MQPVRTKYKRHAQFSAAAAVSRTAKDKLKGAQPGGMETQGVRGGIYGGALL